MTWRQHPRLKIWRGSHALLDLSSKGRHFQIGAHIEFGKLSGSDPGSAWGAKRRKVKGGKRRRETRREAEGKGESRKEAEGGGGRRKETERGREKES